MQEEGKGLRSLLSAMTKYPQTMINLSLSSHLTTEQKAVVSEITSTSEKALAAWGRLLVRPSGTEPLLRVMVEGEKASQVKDMAEKIADKIQKAL